jgi:hypothetical protein
VDLGILLPERFLFSPCLDWEDTLITLMKTIVNITIVEDESGFTRVRMDAIGEGETALALGLQVIGHLSLLEDQAPDLFRVEMPTISQGFQ